MQAWPPPTASELAPFSPRTALGRGGCSASVHQCRAHPRRLRPSTRGTPLRSAQLNAIPTPTAVAPLGSPLTMVAELAPASLVVPSPSWPLSLAPQQATVPSSSTGTNVLPRRRDGPCLLRQDSPHVGGAGNERPVAELPVRLSPTHQTSPGEPDEGAHEMVAAHDRGGRCRQPGSSHRRGYAVGRTVAQLVPRDPCDPRTVRAGPPPPVSAQVSYAPTKSVVMPPPIAATGVSRSVYVPSPSCP